MLALFRRSVQAQAQREADAIEQELEALHRKETDRMEDDLLQEAYEAIQRQVRELEAQTATAVSRRRAALRRELLARRAQLEEEVFAQAQERLRRFADGPEYAAFLRRRAEALAAQCPWEGSVLTVRPADEALGRELLAFFGPGASLRTDPALEPGGFLLRNDAHGVLGDESLQGALQAQRMRFRAHPELQVEL